jgi:hypothetical protein
MSNQAGARSSPPSSAQNTHPLTPHARSISGNLARQFSKTAPRPRACAACLLTLGEAQGSEVFCAPYLGELGERMVVRASRMMARA